MLKDTPIGALWEPIALLAVLAVAVLGLAVTRFRADLAPAGRARRPRTPSASEVAA